MNSNTMSENDKMEYKRRISDIKIWIDAEVSRRYRAEAMLAKDPTWAQAIVDMDSNIRYCQNKISEILAEAEAKGISLT